MTPSQERGFTVRALGEIAIRCRDLGAMERFYLDVIGLELLSQREGGITFFKIADGHEGHTTVLALFDANETGGQPQAGARSSLHHLALTIGWEEQARAIAWYERIGQPHHIQDFPWIGWRGLFTEDPEGNTVELVAATPDGPA